MGEEWKEEYAKAQAKQRNKLLVWLGGLFSGIGLFYVIFNTDEDKYKISSILRFIFTLLKIFGLFILGVVIIYGVFMVISDIIEKYKLKSIKYGTKLDINGHKMVVAQYGIEKEKTIVIFTGLLSASPVLHYKPFTEKLCEKYRVVVLEPFGYGLSDMLDPKVKGNERTIQNIVKEYHAAIKQLGINKYYILGHSIGGAYTLCYANTYQDEVLGCIVFDATTLYDEELMKLTDQAVSKLALISKLGVQRINSIFNKRNVFLPLYEKYDYSKEDIEMFRVLALQKSLNKTVLNESALMFDNLISIKDMKFPKHIPVLDYVCSVNVKAISNFKDTHLVLGTECNSYELIELEGDHSFYFLDNYDAISKKIDNFIQ